MNPDPSDSGYLPWDSTGLLNFVQLSPSLANHLIGSCGAPAFSPPHFGTPDFLQPLKFHRQPWNSRGPTALLTSSHNHWGRAGLGIPASCSFYPPGVSGRALDWEPGTWGPARAVKGQRQGEQKHRLVRLARGADLSCLPRWGLGTKERSRPAGRETGAGGGWEAETH